MFRELMAIMTSRLLICTYVYYRIKMEVQSMDK
jgi:hypothetical protein